MKQCRSHHPGEDSSLIGLVASITSLPLRLARPACASASGRRSPTPQARACRPRMHFLEVPAGMPVLLLKSPKFGGCPAADPDFVSVLLQAFAEGLANFTGPQHRTAFHSSHPSQSPVGQSTLHHAGRQRPTRLYRQLHAGRGFESGHSLRPAQEAGAPAARAARALGGPPRSDGSATPLMMTGGERCAAGRPPRSGSTIWVMMRMDQQPRRRGP